MPKLPGTPSDELPVVLAAGRSGITTVFLSMSERHPDGRDVDHIVWHSLDHRPEQYRLAGLRASLRLVSTPQCRAARAVSSPRYDAVDHVMSYFFADQSPLASFLQLGDDLWDAGRIPDRRPPLVERGVFAVQGMAATQRVVVGADVLPWWPPRGNYLLVEQGPKDPSGITEMPGVAGAWWMTGIPLGSDYSSTVDSNLQITYCFLDEDPAETGNRLRGWLEKRWNETGTVPLFAAPFHVISPYDWDRYLP